MKTQALQSIKFKRLKRLLGRPDYVIVGVLESLWMFASNNCKLGDVGRFDNEELAASIEWEGDADQLIDAMIHAGWLDRSPVCRLVIHDWYMHAPQFVTRSINRELDSQTEAGWRTRVGLASQTAADETSSTAKEPRQTGAITISPKTTLASQTEVGAATNPVLASQTELEHELPHAQPNQTKPSQTKPNQLCMQTSLGEACETRVSDRPPSQVPDPTDTVDDVVDAWNAAARRHAVIPTVRKLTPSRRRKLLVRLRNPDWPWREAIAKLPVPNDKKFDWQPDFDWILKNDENAEKLAGGSYDRRGGGAFADTGPDKQFRPADAGRPALRGPVADSRRNHDDEHGDPFQRPGSSFAAFF